MKKSHTKKTHTSRRIPYSQLVSSLRRVLRVIGAGVELTLNSRVFKKGPSEIFLMYNDLQKTNTQLLKMERQKAEAIQLIRKRNQLI